MDIDVSSSELAFIQGLSPALAYQFSTCKFSIDTHRPSFLKAFAVTLGSPNPWVETTQYSLQSVIPLTDHSNDFIAHSFSNGLDDPQPLDVPPPAYDSLDLHGTAGSEIRNVGEHLQAVGNTTGYQFLSSPIEGTAPQDIVEGAVLSPDSPEDQPPPRAIPMSMPYSFDPFTSGKSSKAMRNRLINDWSRIVDNNGILKLFSKRAKEKVATINTLRASAARRKTDPKFWCDITGCRAGFTRKHNLDSEYFVALSAQRDAYHFSDHFKSHCGVTDRICPSCGKGFTTIPVCKRHRRTCEARKAVNEQSPASKV